MPQSDFARCLESTRRRLRRADTELKRTEALNTQSA